MDNNFVAIVIGGSIGGLMAAKVLSKHYDKVYVFEKRKFSQDGISPEVELPQIKHNHGLLRKGTMNLESIFPGLQKELKDYGAKTIMMGTELPWFHHGYWKKPFKNGIPTVFLTRILLEKTIRKRVLSVSNIEIIYEATVHEFIFENNLIKGCKFTIRENFEQQICNADIVIECTGRGSKLKNWLKNNNLEEVKSSKVKMKAGYSTIYIERDNNDFNYYPNGLIYVADRYEIAAIMPIENNQWILSVAGILGEYPASTYDELLEFIKKYKSPIIHNIAKNAKPLHHKKVEIARFDENCWNHYENLKKLPYNLFIMGDSFASFNPIYGQGMTMASFGAINLDSILSSNKNNLARASKRYYAQMKTVIDHAWKISSIEDLRYPEVEGQRDISFNFIKKYIDKVHLVSSYSENVHRKFLEVQHMLKPASSMFAPLLMIKVWLLHKKYSK